MTDTPPAKSPGLIARLARARPTKPGEIYGVPGQGNTFWLSVGSVAVMLFVWWLVTTLGLVKPLFVPPPQLVLAKFGQIWREGFTNTSFLEHIFISTARVFGAFLLACIIGLPLGLAMGMSPLIRGIFDPPIEFYRPLPPLSYLPLVIIWFGIDELPKIILIYLACFAPLALAARSGMRSASQEQIHAAYSMGASRWQVVRHVILPSALPEILVGMRIAIGFGWTTLVAAEMVAAKVGLGQMVLNASNFLRTDIVVMGIIVIGVVAYSFDLLMRWAERRLVPWKGRS
jgi:taurine transport system permease protein